MSGPHTENRPPMANWPLWKVVVASAFTYAAFGGFFYASLFVPPRHHTSGLIISTCVLVLAGVSFSIWRRLTGSWWASVGVSVALTVQMMAISLRFWSILVQGTAYWIMVGVAAAAYIAAWFLPVIWPTVSRVIWREQTSPETRVGRAILRWSLALGLGGAGIVGAASGTALVRTGEASVAYAFVAIGMGLATVFLAQSLAQGLWQDRRSASQPSTIPKDAGG